MTELALTWRAFRPDDVTERNYVISSWLKSYADTSRRRWQRLPDGTIDEGGEFQGMRLNVYYALYAPHVPRLLEQSTIAVCCTPELPDDAIVGWMALEDGVLHYVHTKKHFRRMGVAKWMLDGVRDASLTYTHQFAHSARALIGARWSYDPMRRFEKRA